MPQAGQNLAFGRQYEELVAAWLGPGTALTLGQDMVVAKVL